jgi:hypothetical protein
MQGTTPLLIHKNVSPFLVFIHLNSLINLWNSGFKKKIILQISGGKTGTEMEIFFSFPVADPDILKI